MAVRYRLLLFSSLIFVLVGCGSSAFSTALEYEAVEDTEVVRVMQYLDERGEGPLYAVSMTVPEEWVGQFETISEGNSITFAFIDEVTGVRDLPAADNADDEVEAEERRTRRAEIFHIDALSRPQYWQQVGSYPGDYTNIIFTADTYFTYSVPIFAFYSGLPDDEFEAFTAAVDEIIASFSVERVDVMDED